MGTAASAGVLHATSSCLGNATAGNRTVGNTTQANGVCQSLWDIYTISLEQYLVGHNFAFQTFTTTSTDAYPVTQADNHVYTESYTTTVVSTVTSYLPATAVSPTTPACTLTKITGAAAVCQSSWDNYWTTLGWYENPWYLLTETTTYTTTGTGFNNANSPVETYTTSGVLTEQSQVSRSVSSPTTPSCSEPAGLASCASAWSTWTAACYPFCDYSWRVGIDTILDEGGGMGTPTPPTSTAPTPNCPQPLVTGSACTGLQSEYVWPLGQGEPGISTGGTDFESQFSLAPGCTLGCGSCSLAAGSVGILYWTSASKNISVNATMPMTAAPITSIAVVDGTTLTSPQVYLSYVNVSASNWCSGIGSNHSIGIVPINTDNLSIMMLDDEAIGGLLTPEPLPFSSFLWMQSMSYTVFYLSIPPELRSIDGAWNDCGQISIGALEPPSVLVPTAVAEPTLPTSIPSTTPASPAPVKGPTTASATSNGSPSTAPAPKGSQAPPALPSSTAPGPDNSSPPPTTSQGESDARSPSGKSGPIVASSPENIIPNPSPTTATSSNPNIVGVTTESSAAAAQPQNALSVLNAAQTTYAGAGGTAASGVVGGSTVRVATPTIVPIAVVPLGASTLTIQSGQPLVLGSATLTPNGPAVPISNQVVSLGNQGVVVGSSTYAYTLSPVPTSQAIIPGPGSYSALTARLTTDNSAGTVAVVNEFTLSAGGHAVTIAGQTISLAAGSSGSPGAVVNGGSTIAFSAASALQTTAVPIAVFTLGTTPVTASGIGSGAAGLTVVVAGSTLSLGGAALTTDGQTISLGASGLIVGDGSDSTSSTIAIAMPIGASSSRGGSITQVVLTASGQTLKAIEEGTGTVVVGGKTMVVGGSAVTVNGVIVSEGSSGLVVDGSSTVPFTVVPSLASTSTSSDGGSSSTIEQGGAVRIPGALEGLLGLGIVWIGLIAVLL